MKRVVYFVFAIILFIKICNAQALEVEVLDYSIVSSFSSPGPSPQGLAWDGEFLWVSDDSTDTIYKISPEDGIVIKSFCFPDNDPKGITWDGSNLWVAFGISNTINKLNPENGEVVKTLNAVYHDPEKSWPIHGLAWDGANLWCSYFAGWSSAVITIDVNDGSGHEWFFCDSEDITFDGSSLWNVGSYNGNHKGFVSKRALPLGSRIAYFRTPGNYPTGLTWDGIYLWLADCDTDTIYQIDLLITGVETDSSPAPFMIYQNYPNPFNPTTTITYSIAEPSNVKLVIYFVSGQKVATLVDGHMTAGKHSTTFDGSNLSSGVYFYSFESKGFTKTGKMLDKIIQNLRFKI